MNSRAIRAVLLLATYNVLCAAAAAATLPAGFSESTVTSALNAPTAMAFAPDGRLFVCQQGGQLRVIKNGALLSTPFMTITVDANGERGLLGIAFDPDFGNNQFLYVYYTVPGTPPHNRVSRFKAIGDVRDASVAELPILDLENLSGATNHNGGAIHFGSDGKLYVAVGENANTGNSQVLTNRLGKMLRINSDGSIPSDNPTTIQGIGGAPTGLNRAIWAVGLRNPYTFGVQPGSGRLFINDVGSSGGGVREEINDGLAGRNFGWAVNEGYIAPNPNYTSPLHAYAHSSGECAITGGTFYNPAVTQFPAPYVGKYFFSDLCGGFIRYIDPASTSPATSTGFATGFSQPVDLQVGPDGGLYVLARGSGAVIRILAAATAPTITQHPASASVGLGLTATFSVTASSATPLTYQWQKNNANITGATGPSYTTPGVTIADHGALYRCIVTNSIGPTISNAATLTVLEALLAPIITQHPASPSVGLGQTATFSVAASSATQLTYQWQKNNANITGATGPSYTTPAVTIADHGALYRCIVTNAIGSTISNAATLTVLDALLAPIITQHPASASVGLGQTATFSVAASSATQLTYQWQKNNANIAGATGQSYTTPAATIADHGALYRCIVTNAIGSTISNAATLTVLDALLAPIITQHPASASVGLGQTATFSVTASSATPLTYQWQKNNANIAGATGQSYITPAATIADHGTLYRCIVTNAIGSTISNAATLTVLDFPIVSPPVGQPPRGLDFNGDGLGDVFVYDAATGAWTARFATANGFHVAGGSWAPQWGITPGDFNADGLTDFLLYNRTTGVWSVSTNDGSGGFTHLTGTWSAQWQVRVLDLSGDGRSDVFLYNADDGVWFTCVTEPAGGFAYTRGTWSPGWQLHPADLNGDGRRDLFLYSAATGQWFWALASPGGTAFTYLAGSWSPAWDVYTGEFNGDARTDILVYNSTTGAWFLCGNTGAGFSYQEGAWSPQWTVRIGDLDADERDDVFLYNVGSGQWFEAISGNSGFTFASGYWSPGWQVFVTNLSGDRRADVVVYDPSTGLFFQCLNAGLGAFSYASGSWGAGQMLVVNR